MRTYEIYLASSSCDEEWDYLGTVQAESVTDALQQASQRWEDHAPEALVALETDLVLS